MFEKISKKDKKKALIKRKQIYVRNLKIYYIIRNRWFDFLGKLFITGLLVYTTHNTNNMFISLLALISVFLLTFDLWYYMSKSLSWLFYFLIVHSRYMWQVYLICLIIFILSIFVLYSFFDFIMALKEYGIV